MALEPQLKQRAAASGQPVTTKIYKDAGHAFLADYRPSYREKPASRQKGAIAACRRSQTVFVDCQPRPPIAAGLPPISKGMRVQ